MPNRDQFSGEPIEPAMNSPLDYAVAQRDRETMALVRRAVGRGDVVLAFQPVVQAARPDRPAFYEGLIRLLDDAGRIIPARDFIESVETAEIGRQIDCLALEMGLIALAEDPDLRLAINMSARSIGYPAWMKTLNKGLARDDTAAERLILEITESSAMVLPDLVSFFMQDLQQRGVSFALDDFGAGQTSFRYLREFFFDIVKIDGQFIRGIAENPDNQALTKALISVAQHFEMFTVAESVENARDCEYLQSIGIDCMQGYYFGAPTIMPPWKTPTAQMRASG
ncbi:EAL domain-containing protein [Phaeovulum vinaykumarii]|uniref:EAL domain, c-di-GMP-specific phosphodiesterase class I (Or its enzymatically inactive variant) n=1 Tax=Phaeovulum vinaykumarii TaxID=407234 RepID=A0A1N7KTZ9_9RHOB|nr:EAL domain-containing protein [Phaeovulum vinaykumarii]SIS65069.1 EAL domain, c-di-GMP-specific phosphodiesterase class I (or its enzymatically inactive variant) [Phaeovulum vinaykumarii]SOC01419.1 EAL domain-containing protein (putative c-di-GMP-specific phosphodiesterase class I) [Phaeovulum vinaykumarii]